MNEFSAPVDPTTTFAGYAWIITRDYTVALTEPCIPDGDFEIPPHYNTVAIAGPSDAHPAAVALLRTDERAGEPFQLWDDDRCLYYTGRWIEDITTIDLPSRRNYHGDPLDDYGTPSAGCTIMTVNNRQPCIG